MSLAGRDKSGKWLKGTAPGRPFGATNKYPRDLVIALIQACELVGYDPQMVCEKCDGLGRKFARTLKRSENEV